MGIRGVPEILTKRTDPNVSLSVFRRTPARLLLLAAVLFLLGSFVPPLAIGAMRPLPAGLHETFRTRPLDGTELHREMTVTTPEKVRRAAIAATTVTREFTGPDDTLSGESSETVLLDRGSRFPVREKDAPAPREGLRFFFPFPTERVSYPVYDPVPDRAFLIDYVSEGEHNGVEAFEFHHTDTFEVEDGTWFHVERTMWVEPRSGTLLDVVESGHLFRAADRSEAEARATEPDPGHTLRHSSERWDDATLARQQDTATGVGGTLRLLQIFAVLMKALALVAALTAVALLLRDRARGRTS